MKLSTLLAATVSAANIDRRVDIDVKTGELTEYRSESVGSIFGVQDMNSPTCITNSDACDFVGNDCCVQDPSSPPCWAFIHGSDSMKGEMSILVGGGVGQPFCDDFYNEFYGDVTEMRMYCGTSGRQFVEGLATRYGPAPGSNIFAWSQVHGGSQQDSQFLNWIFTGKMITDIDIFHNGQYMTGIRAYVAEEGTNVRQELTVCGNAGTAPSSVIVNRQQSNGLFIEKCVLKYIAGSDTQGSNNHIHSLSFYFRCRE